MYLKQDFDFLLSEFVSIILEDIRFLYGMGRRMSKIGLEKGHSVGKGLLSPEFGQMQFRTYD